ncbi:hypothetical protein Bca4012_031421 [Brassica carinata]
MESSLPKLFNICIHICILRNFERGSIESVLTVLSNFRFINLKRQPGRGQEIQRSPYQERKNKKSGTRWPQRMNQNLLGDLKESKSR